MQNLIKLLLTLVLLCFINAPSTASVNTVSKQQAIRAATANFPGKVVKVSTSSRHYQIRVLQKNGRVVMVKVDKRTGKVLTSRKKGR